MSRGHSKEAGPERKMDRNDALTSASLCTLQREDSRRLLGTMELESYTGVSSVRGYSWFMPQKAWQREDRTTLAWNPPRLLKGARSSCALFSFLYYTTTTARPPSFLVSGPLHMMFLGPGSLFPQLVPDKFPPIFQVSVYIWFPKKYLPWPSNLNLVPSSLLFLVSESPSSSHLS